MTQFLQTRPSRLVLFGIFATVIAWRAISTNVSDFLLQQEDPENTAQAVRWNPDSPFALYQHGATLAAKDPGQAIPLFQDAISKHPGYALPFAAIAIIREREGDIEGATRAMGVATRMAPQRVDIQLEAGRFWLRREDYTLAMKHISTALKFGWNFHSILFPDLLKLAENEASRNPAFESLLKENVSWWPYFMEYVANHGKLETLRALFELQANSPTPVREEELRTYITRLQRDHQWPESYLVWLNHLNNERLHSLGNIFNGSFEERITNFGFDWIITPASQVIIEAASTAGASGKRALQVTFKGPRIQFKNVHQYTILKPGNYMLHGRARPESLETVEGIQWAIYCVGSPTAIATSQPFSGSHRWRNFSLQFKVPSEECAIQQLRLELAGSSNADYEARGTIWFDDIDIAQFYGTADPLK